MMDSSFSRALTELSPSSPIRNSPNVSQPTKRININPDSSPFQSSPFTSSIDGNSSPRLFWPGRETAIPSRLNTENIFAGKESSPSPTRRTSLEKLQRASRVKNSNMFAREQKRAYDPTSVPVVERPLIKTWHGNAFGGSGPEDLRSPERSSPFRHWRGNCCGSSLPSLNSSPSKTPTQSRSFASLTTSKDHILPTKSSLSAGRFKSNLESEMSHLSEDASADERELPPGRTLHRHAKSVTFDERPPQVNEYEMATPDLSSIGTGSLENSFDSGDEDEYNTNNCDDMIENDNSFDASLEDTEKTPVVGPDDWRNASPDLPTLSSLSCSFEDPFHDSPRRSIPDSSHSSFLGQSSKRTDSLNSNSEQRPLPPIPRFSTPDRRTNSSSSVGIPAAAERAKNSPRNLPSTAVASSITKAETQGLSGSRMSLGERLKLMILQDDDNPKNDAERQRDRRMRRASNRDRNSETPERPAIIDVCEDDDSLDEFHGLGTYQLPPRISRESILRKVNGQSAVPRESDYNFSSPLQSSSPERPCISDPDVPLPSTENEWGFAKEDNKKNNISNVGVLIKPESDEDDLNLHELSEISLEIRPNELIDDISILGEEDTLSQYSEPTPDIQILPKAESDQNNAALTSSPQQEAIIINSDSEDSENQLLKSTNVLLTNEGSDNILTTPTEPLTPTETIRQSTREASDLMNRPETPTNPSKASTTMPDSDVNDWGSGASADEFEIGTPESVIHHPIWESSPRESPSIPEQVATIRSASGSSKLKTRPSATPSDLESMREVRRNVSREIPLVPPIPIKHQDRPMSVDRAFVQSMEDRHENSPGFQRSLTLDIDKDLSLNLENDFDRVVQAQKRGYLMRQNTKIVVATSETGTENRFHSTRSAGNSPVKLKHTDSWTVEPWNGQRRKSSIHNNSAPRNRPTSGSIPPMPDKKSSESTVTDDSSLEEITERGRLFVRVLGVKDLNLPLPSNEQTWFNLTLDNGVHCVTTAWLELGRNAPIGQEFELVVPKDLEFQLTLNVKLVKPTPKRVESPTKGFKVHKPSTFSKVFSSPRKRKEIEARLKEEQQYHAKLKEQEALAKRASSLPSAWDILSPFAAEDGSFGRSYVCLKDHESRCYGRPYVADVSCFNEWATEQVNQTSSVMSKRSSTHIRRRAPYKVASLELQLLFVPMPKGASDDDMPKSMNSCIREMKEAEKALSWSWEGHLSQQGGDCPYWRRRYFKLLGSKLTAYHESTRQPRVTINLANACKLIDDRTALIQKETTGLGGKRRKSGFAEEEEGYMFVEEGFRIRFNNGEVIDFYADTSADKENWMKILDGCIGKEGDNGKRAWCNLVLKREQSMRRRGESEATLRKSSRLHQRTKSSLA